MMSEENVIIDELEAEPIETGSEPIADLIDAIKAQDFNAAESQFNDLVGERLSDTLDQAKIAIADQIFNAQAETWADAGDDAEDDIEEEDEDLDDSEV
jgi:hypothetical protein|tara:strand:- start:2606 stop:2899 length:294 start_codon:yes stop_codon:yes gene_type:complete